MNEYEEKAREFVEKTKTRIEKVFLGNKLYFDIDEEPRDVYNITLITEKGNMSFTYGQSLADKGKLPTAYDILSCLSYDCYPVGSFEDFCSCYGYDNDSIKAHKTYKKVKQQREELIKLYTKEELELLQEIE